MLKIKKSLFCLSATLLLALPFSGAAKQSSGKGAVMVTDDRIPADQGREGIREGEPDDQAREREEKALERMDKARHRGESEGEESTKGLEKQRKEKLDKDRKEIDKGSEQGQKMRQEHSRKWWKFWE